MGVRGGFVKLVVSVRICALCVNKVIFPEDRTILLSKNNSHFFLFYFLAKELRLLAQDKSTSVRVQCMTFACGGQVCNFFIFIFDI